MAAPSRSSLAHSDTKEMPAESGVLALLPPDAETEHSLDLGGRKLSYKATAGTLGLFGQDGQRSAAVFYTSYVAENAGPDRPLTFVFNGGPGAASAFLHLGLVGPKILDFGPTGRDGSTARLVDNPQSWLDFTDLVLIDPVGTGWSRTAKADDAKNFYGVRQDAVAIAKTIALYLSHTGRISSTKYLLGESYGGLRAIKVAKALQQDQGVIISGIVMLSPLLEGALQFGASRFALGASLQLPTLAAAELERRNAFSTKEIEAIEQYARTEYLTTLAGPPPATAAAESFYERVAQLTGLPLETVRNTRGFIRDAYVKHLKEGGAAVVSPYDVMFTAPDPFPESDSSRGDDPVLDGFVRAYGGAFVNYARDQLSFKTEMTYALLASDINGKWDWGNGRSGGSRAQISVSDDIRELLAVNPSLRIMIAHGYSDMITPYAVNKYVVNHLPENLASRVAFKVYRGGHMLYTTNPSRIAFSADAKIFYAGQSRD
ncbi:S10 family serine carboxypeptidase-like protein [Bradyrhizobium elkanii]|uniref:S10 family peptidase n=1 Tax=Bradyrhizobium elkanii TaxID=29448 RepID=UPI0012BCBCA8